jgi:uncharacterized protein YcaQ
LLALGYILVDSLSNAEAKLMALAAQGFAEPRPRKPTIEHLKAVIDRLRLIQIDSVNVMARAHYMPLFARLGPYRQQLLDELAYKHQFLFEQWAHEACYIPIEDYPLFHQQMLHGRRWGARGLAPERLAYFEEVLEQVRQRGPVRTGEMENAGKRQGWWGWSHAKIGLEYQFAHGRLAVRERRNFARVYDLPERVFAPEVLALPGHEREDAHRQMLRYSARALGVATAADLRDYYRLKAVDVAPRIQELVALGELLPVNVEGWKDAAYRWHEAELPLGLKATALLSPFDNLIWDRKRTERMFGFHYRIEIYTPAPQRVFGYYVLPFMANNELAARVDLKANRQAKVLEVKAAHLQPPARPAPTARALARELRLVAKWLGLGSISVETRGDLAGALAEQIER